MKIPDWRHKKKEMYEFVGSFTSFHDQFMASLGENDQLLRDIRNASDEDLVELTRRYPQIIRFMAGYITLQSSAELAKTALERLDNGLDENYP